jgi:hypothetical protein
LPFRLPIRLFACLPSFFPRFSFVFHFISFFFYPIHMLGCGLETDE